MGLRITKFIILCFCLAVLAVDSLACTQIPQTTANLTATELCILANQKLNNSAALISVGPDERWNLSYQAVSARKLTEQDLMEKDNLKAGDWLLDIKVTMIHEYFQNGLWVTPPKNPVNYRLARYTYSTTMRTFQELD